MGDSWAFPRLSEAGKTYWRNILVEASETNKFVKITTAPCAVCGKASEFTLDSADVKKWMNGAMIQEALPYLDTMERETLISGVCSQKCWDELWG